MVVKDWETKPYFTEMLQEMYNFLKIGSDYEREYFKLIRRVRDSNYAFTEVFLRTLCYPLLIYFMEKQKSFEESMEVVLYILDFFVKNQLEMFAVHKLYQCILRSSLSELIECNSQEIMKILLDYQPFKCTKRDLQGRVILLFNPKRTRSIRNLENDSYVRIFRRFFVESEFQNFVKVN